MAEKRRIVVIGGVAAGPKAAARARRLDPSAEVTVIEMGADLSYAGCGLPYYIGGTIGSRADLVASPIGVPRDAAFFKKTKDITVLTRTEAVQIDRGAREVEVVDLETGKIGRVRYDTLIIATGATPVDPPIPGKELHNVLELKDVRDADAFRESLALRKEPRVVVVGGGLVGLEMAEVLRQLGCHVTIVELFPHILPVLDTDMARLVENYIRSHGVELMTGSRVERLEGNAAGSVKRVVTDAGSLPADIVLMSIGIRPNVDLAQRAGLVIGPRGGIHVDAMMRTSDPNILAAGDCTEKLLSIAGTSTVLPLGSVANKEGRVAGTNAVLGGRRFSGVMGTTVLKVFDWCIGRTGLSCAQAKQLGLSVLSTVVAGPDRAHYYPGAKLIIIKLVVDRSDRRVLGVQALGPGDVSKRIDVAVTAMTARMTADDVAGLDLSYAPPYSSAMDILVTAADSARNLLDGLYKNISSEGLQDLRVGGEDFMLLDVRTPGEFEESHIPGATLIPLGALRERMDEVPRNKPVVALCKSSLRAYEAACLLRGNGHTNASVLSGGMLAWPFDTASGG